MLPACGVTACVAWGECEDGLIELLWIKRDLRDITRCNVLTFLGSQFKQTSHKWTFLKHLRKSDSHVDDTGELFILLGVALVLLLYNKMLENFFRVGAK